MDWREARMGSYIGKGWEPVVDLLHKQILEVAPNVVVDQVKEKFGGLRYYWSVDHETFEKVREGSYNEETVGKYIERLVSQAETVCYWLCEECGKVGTTGGHGGFWVKTLCPEHAEAHGS